MTKCPHCGKEISLEIPDKFCTFYMHGVQCEGRMYHETSHISKVGEVLYFWDDKKRTWISSALNDV